MPINAVLPSKQAGFSLPICQLIREGKTMDEVSYGCLLALNRSK